MKCSQASDELADFIKSGIYRLHSNAVFMDPVRILNRSYTRYQLSSTAYYSRFFQTSPPVHPAEPDKSRKRKRKARGKVNVLNEKELAANRRHQEARPFLIKSYQSLIVAKELLCILPSLGVDADSSGMQFSNSKGEPFLVELGKVWQAPLYEIHLNVCPKENGGSSSINEMDQRVLPIFNNLISNDAYNDLEADFLNSRYIIPRDSCFFMSDLGQIHNLTSGLHGARFNVIVIDPPWENKSVHKKSIYPTLPNRYMLSLPVKQLVHADGALVALWVTNREKLRSFVEEKLFPMWGVRYISSLYWLKVKSDGSLISDLDLTHHRPYECLLIGWCHLANAQFSRLNTLQDNQVVISIPGDRSRKPPVGELLFAYVPDVCNAARGIELFAREMMAGWTSWGNEPIHFQRSEYFRSNLA